MHYFSKIDQSLHPKRKDYLKKLYISDQSKNNLSKKDIKILSEIVSFKKKFDKKQSLGGTWEWIEKNKRNYIKTKNLKNLSKLFSNFFRNHLSYGLISSHWKPKMKIKNSEKLVSDILKNISVWEEFTQKKISDYKFLENNKNIGNPYGLIFKNKLILYDTPRHDYYANKIQNLIFHKNKIPTILEVGGGFGGLLTQLLKRKLKFNYINIDLYKSLQIAYYFIKKNFEKKIIISKIVSNDIFKKKNQIIFVPYNKQEFWNSNLKVDILFNSNSFSEMGKKSLLHYFKIINNKIKPKYILHQNSNLKSFSKLKIYKEIPSSKFPIDSKSYDLLNFGLSNFQGGSGRYREYLYKRKNKKIF